MNKRTTILAVILVLGLLVVGAGLASAQANCLNADGCPLGQQNGPMGGGRFGGGPQRGMMQGQMGGQQNGMPYGQQNGAAGRGMMGNGMGMMNGGMMANGTGMMNGAAGRGMMGNGTGMMNGGMGNGQCGQPGSFACLPAATDASLTDEQVSLMTAGWLDEINAQAVYAGIVKQFGSVRPFVNLQAAEAQHASAWAFLFDRYGVELPDAAPTVEVPVFATVSEACQFALDAETGNAALYDDLAASFTDYPDITQIITSLRNASEQNHTAALENCAAL
jgi:hypothetical protein